MYSICPSSAKTHFPPCRFRPPDACYLEIMRFRVRPPKARELPISARCVFQITGQRVEIRADMMIPYPHTKAWGQVPCEDVAMRIPLPECWIYQFRTEKAHLSLSQLATGNISLGSRMGSVKSAHRRAGKVIYIIRNSKRQIYKMTLRFRSKVSRGS